MVGLIPSSSAMFLYARENKLKFYQRESLPVQRYPGSMSVSCYIKHIFDTVYGWHYSVLTVICISIQSLPLGIVVCIVSGRVRHSSNP